MSARVYFWAIIGFSSLLVLVSAVLELGFHIREFYSDIASLIIVSLVYIDWMISYDLRHKHAKHEADLAL